VRPQVLIFDVSAADDDKKGGVGGGGSREMYVMKEASFRLEMGARDGGVDGEGFVRSV
jgi:hypothetical protein